MYCRWQYCTYSGPKFHGLHVCLHLPILKESSHCIQNVSTPDIFCRCDGSPEVACGATQFRFHNHSQWPTCQSPFVANIFSFAVLTLHSSTVTLTERQLDSKWAIPSESEKKVNIFKEWVTILHLELVSFIMEQILVCAICFTWLEENLL